jgi:hypothetical protein
MGLRNTPTKITLHWYDGGITTGATWREIEDNIRASQWFPFDSRHEFRDEMRARAIVWSGTHLPSMSHNSEKFVRDLESAQFYSVEVEYE